MAAFNTTMELLEQRLAKPKISAPWTFTEKRKFLIPGLEEANWKEIRGVSGKEILHTATQSKEYPRLVAL